MEYMPIPTWVATFDAAARFFENELHEMRRQAIANYNHARDHGHADPVAPVTTSHEGDLMRAAEFACHATRFRMLADEERKKS